MTGELIRDVFDLDAVVVSDPVSGTPMVLPRGRHHILTPEPEETRAIRS
jgi:iron complex transport system ATP-binding protein